MLGGKKTSICIIHNLLMFKIYWYVQNNPDYDHVKCIFHGNESVRVILIRKHKWEFVMCCRLNGVGVNFTAKTFYCRLRHGLVSKQLKKILTSAEAKMSGRLVPSLNKNRHFVFFVVFFFYIIFYHWKLHFTINFIFSFYLFILLTLKKSIFHIAKILAILQTKIN